MTIQERISVWRDDAAVLRRRGARRAAALMERLAAELEDDLRGGAADQDAPELVEIRAAVALSGYTCPVTPNFTQLGDTKIYAATSPGIRDSSGDCERGVAELAVP